MHGGGFTSGKRNGKSERELAEEFAMRGYVAFSISYRLMGRHGPAKEQGSWHAA